MIASYNHGATRPSRAAAGQVLAGGTISVAPRGPAPASLLAAAAAASGTCESPSITAKDTLRAALSIVIDSLGPRT